MSRPVLLGRRRPSADGPAPANLHYADGPWAGERVSNDLQANLVLLLEDYEPAAEAMAMLLEDWGYECLHAGTVEALLPALPSRAGQVRAVVCDYHLDGGTTGLDALAALARAGVSVPALLLTGSSGALAQPARNLGYKLAEKPVDSEWLRRWIAEAGA